jgi:hypothetical protein
MSVVARPQRPHELTEDRKRTLTTETARRLRRQLRSAPAQKARKMAASNGIG